MLEDPLVSFSTLDCSLLANCDLNSDFVDEQHLEKCGRATRPNHALQSAVRRLAPHFMQYQVAKTGNQWRTSIAALESADEGVIYCTNDVKFCKSRRVSKESNEFICADVVVVVLESDFLDHG